MTDWADGETWNIPGVYYAEEEALVYGMEAAVKPVARGGWSRSRRKEGASDE